MAPGRAPMPRPRPWLRTRTISASVCRAGPVRSGPEGETTVNTTAPRKLGSSAYGAAAPGQPAVPAPATWPSAWPRCVRKSRRRRSRTPRRPISSALSNQGDAGQWRDRLWCHARRGRLGRCELDAGECSGPPSVAARTACRSPARTVVIAGSWIRKSSPRSPFEPAGRLRDPATLISGINSELLGQDQGPGVGERVRHAHRQAPVDSAGLAPGRCLLAGCDLAPVPRSRGLAAHRVRCGCP